MLESIIQKYANFIKAKTKTKFAAFNVVIILIMLFPLGFSVFCFVGHNEPHELKQQTGFVADYSHITVPKILEDFDIFHSSYSFTLQDDSSYESMGINYDLLDKSLFDDLVTKEKITITYFQKPDSTKLIYAIEYGGKEYLSLQDSLMAWQKNQEFSYLFGTLLIVASVGVGIILFVLNYKRNKTKN